MSDPTTGGDDTGATTGDAGSTGTDGGGAVDSGESTDAGGTEPPAGNGGSTDAGGTETPAGNEESTDGTDPLDDPDVNQFKGKFYDKGSEYLGAAVDEHRPYLARGLDGRVMDLGGGTGLMLPHFEAEAGDDLSVHLVDPDDDFRAWAETKVDDYGFAVTVRDGRAESLPYEDDSFDAVVCSQVFCTVADVEAGLAEVGRVLRPDGEFRFLEHVHSGGLKGGVETALTPAWKRLADGCHLNRDTGAALEDSDLTVVESERVSVGRFPPNTYIKGTARLPGADEGETP
ncbi:class I SAM-dependent methyltransferase [Halobacteriales archaeon QS_8_69_26]|nr:MAG: class I SAM-dependent methyltransferase [Halobacteriales archaeon QS_8_69_26]